MSGLLGDEAAFSQQEIRNAIAGGAILPREFAPYGGLLGPSQFQPRAALLEQLGYGLLGGLPPAPSSMSGSYAPERRLDGSITPFPHADVRTTIPNAYEGPLDEHEPRMRAQPWAWRM